MNGEQLPGKFQIFLRSIAQETGKQTTLESYFGKSAICLFGCVWVKSNEVMRIHGRQNAPQVFLFLTLLNRGARIDERVLVGSAHSSPQEPKPYDVVLSPNLNNLSVKRYMSGNDGYDKITPYLYQYDNTKRRQESKTLEKHL